MSDARAGRHRHADRTLAVRCRDLDRAGLAARSRVVATGSAAPSAAAGPHRLGGDARSHVVRSHVVWAPSGRRYGAAVGASGEAPAPP